MTDPTERRRFDDEEVALILRRATEMQVESADGGTAAGMSLADLEEVAREAGLDPALVRRAASEVQRGDATVPLHGASRFLGAPTRLRFERVVEGELPVDDYEAVVDEIRRTLNDVGLVSTLGRTLAWRSTPGMRHGRQSNARDVSVTVVVRGGHTGIRVEESTSGLAGGVFGGLLGGLGGGGGGVAVGVGMGALHSAPAAFSLWGALIGGSYVLARAVYGAAMRRRTGALGGLADRLVTLVEDAVRPATPQG